MGVFGIVVHGRAVFLRVFSRFCADPCVMGAFAARGLNVALMLTRHNAQITDESRKENTMHTLYVKEATTDATAGFRRLIAQALTGLLLAGLGAAAHAQTAAPGYTLTPFAAGAAIGASAPDSLAVSGGDVFVGYGNGVDSTGAGGNATSTIAEYTTGGSLEKVYKLVGGNDGLRVDPKTGLLWVLQNQDGNSLLDVVNPRTGAVNTYSYSGNLHPDYSGYDDIVFQGGTAYLSATNPATPGDAVLYKTSTRLPKPGGVVKLTPILSASLNGDLPNAGSLVDTDSLALTPGGNLLLDDQGGSPLGTAPLPSLTWVGAPGTRYQETFQIFPKDQAGNSLSVDDTRFAPFGSHQLLIADTSKNVVYSLTGRFRPLGAYTATKSRGTVGALSLENGVVTPLATGLGSPHGLAFIVR